MKDEANAEALLTYPSSLILHPFQWRYPFCCTFPILLQPLFQSSSPIRGGGLGEGLIRTVGVTHHRVLWSPDFPLLGPPINSQMRITRLCEQRPSGRPVDHYNYTLPAGFYSLLESLIDSWRL